jgi:hypothetical protein
MVCPRVLTEADGACAVSCDPLVYGYNAGDLFSQGSLGVELLGDGAIRYAGDESPVLMSRDIFVILWPGNTGNAQRTSCVINKGSELGGTEEDMEPGSNLSGPGVEDDDFVVSGNYDIVALAVWDKWIDAYDVLNASVSIDRGKTDGNAVDFSGLEDETVPKSAAGEIYVDGDPEADTLPVIVEPRP